MDHTRLLLSRDIMDLSEVEDGSHGGCEFKGLPLCKIMDGVGLVVVVVVVVVVVWGLL